MPDELTPLPYNHKKPPATAITDKPVCVPEMVLQKATLQERIASSKTWAGIKHFFYGFVLAGGGALAAGAAWPAALGVAIVGGAAEAARRVSKLSARENGHKDWADVLDKFLTIVIELIKVWRNKPKEVQK